MLLMFLLGTTTDTIALIQKTINKMSIEGGVLCQDPKDQLH